MTFSKKLKELRKNKGLNQDELAELINQQTGKSFTRTTVSNYETGHSKPTLNITTAIANIFGVSIDYLMGSGDSNNTSDKLIQENGDYQYPKYEQLGASEVYEDAVNYGYQQDELIIKIRNRIEELEKIQEKGNEKELRNALKELLETLTDLTTKYHDQTHKLVDAYQRSNRLAELLKSPYKL